jgi:hypothetical protein
MLNSGFMLLVGSFMLILILRPVLSGWNALARRYAAPRPSSGETVRNAKCVLHRWWPVAFTSARVTVCAHGVELKPGWMDALMARRLLIPWDDMQECRSFKRLRWQFHFVTPEPRVRLFFTGRAATLVAGEFARLNPDRPILTTPR